MIFLSFVYFLEFLNTGQYFLYRGIPSHRHRQVGSNDTPSATMARPGQWLTGSLTGLQARRRRSMETMTRPPRDARVCALASEGHAEARGDSAAPIWSSEHRWR
jgi:hypothetical protein